MELQLVVFSPPSIVLTFILISVVDLDKRAEVIRKEYRFTPENRRGKDRRGETYHDETPTKPRNYSFC